MWEISNKDQVGTFLLALGLGVVFSVIYDIFKSLRLSRRHGVAAVAAEDVIYFFICTLITFAFFIFRTNGQPRAYSYFAMGLGFLLWRFTLSRFAVSLLCKFFCAVFLLYSKIRSGFYRFLGQICILFKKVLKKLRNSAKKGLKGVKQLVYNLFDKRVEN